MSSTAKKIVSAAIVMAIYGAVNLPLIYIIRVHDLPTAIAIIGHAPEQFIFLPMFLPAILYLTFGLVRTIMHLTSRFPEIRQQWFWVWNVRRCIAVMSSVGIGLFVATADRVETTTPDYYQRERSEARTAAQLNREIITSLAAADSESSLAALDEDPEFQRKRTQLRAIYADSTNHDQVLLAFEFVELATVAFLVSVAMWTLYLSVRIVGFAGRTKNKQIAQEIRQCLPFAIVLALVYLIWPILRLYNIYEIRQITEYPTLNPLFAYALLVLVAVALIWLYFTRISKRLVSAFVGVTSMLLSSILVVVVKVKPSLLVYVIGSGLGLGSLMFHVFIVLLFYVFLAPMIRQMTEDPFTMEE